MGEVWPGRDVKIPGHVVLAAEKPEGSKPEGSEKKRAMGVAVSILLIAAGAILAWGVNATSDDFNVNAIGVILLIVGILGLVVSMIFWQSWGGFHSRATYVEGGPVRRTRSLGPRRRTVVEEEEINQELCRKIWIAERRW